VEGANVAATLGGWAQHGREAENGKIPLMHQTWVRSLSRCEIEHLRKQRVKAVNYHHLTEEWI
jgi:hypothetical protein